MATKNKYTNIDLSKYDSGYKESADVIAALNRKNNAENAVTNYGDFAYANQAKLDSLLEQIDNRKKFSYDLNGDALYQQYKDKYINQGKMAMMDTMGQAAALTGGYGNSYAATVGNQAYQAQLQNLNDIVPTLYQMAYDRYNQEGQDLYNRHSLLAADRATAYGEWGDKYNRLVSDRDYYANDYNAARSTEYNEWNDNRNYDTSQYWNEYNAGYRAERDAIADAQWQKEYDAANNEAYYKSQIAALEEKYAGYLSPEMQKAATSSAVKSFQGGLFTENEFAARNNSVKIDGKMKRFDNRTQYVQALLENDYKNEKLTENEVAYLKGLYGIK